MKEVKKMAAQGDVLFRLVDALPSGAVLETRNGALVVAHSETGHHHTIDAPDVNMYRVPGDGMVCFLQLGDNNCDVVHQRSWDTHETLRLLGGQGSIWEVRRQREWTPEGWRRVED